MNAHRTETPAAPPAIPDVLAEHLDEVAFLAVQRRKLIFSHEVDRRRIAAHDERIEAHRDGLRVGGRDAVQLVEKRLESAELWDFFAAMLAWLDLVRPDGEAFAKRVDALPAPLIPPLREALRWAPADAVERCLPAPAPPPPSPRRLALAVDAWCWHGRFPAARAREIARHADVEVRAALARGASTDPGLAAGARPMWEPLAADPDPRVRNRALHALALASPSDAVERCRRAATLAGVDPFAVRLLGLFGELADEEILRDLLSVAAVRIAAVHALGDLGNAAAVERLLPFLAAEDAPLANAATSALAALLGELPRDDEREKRSVDPVPARAAPVAEQWRSVRERFASGKRWQRGRSEPVDFADARAPMESLWRASLGAARAEHAWLRKEVPDDFFTGLPSARAIPGE